MRIAIGADHAGFQLKEYIKERLVKSGYELVDFGTNEEISVDYPDFACKVGESVVNGQSELGILFCGAGIGMSIAANKINGIRAALCSDGYSAKVSREHNSANVLCIGARVTGQELAWDIVENWLKAKPSEDSRHTRRIQKITQLEQVESE